MNVVVFSGTTEGRSFSRALAALGAAVTVCVATELGAEEQGCADGITVRTCLLYTSVQARDGEKIDNMDQALDRAVANGVKNLVVQPTHLMHGAEYDEMCEAVEQYRDKFDSVAIAEPLLGEVGEDAAVINADKEAVAAAITAEAVKTAGYDDAAAAAADGTAFVFMGHGTSHTAKVSYSQMQTAMQTLGYDNVFIAVSYTHLRWRRSNRRSS